MTGDLRTTFYVQLEPEWSRFGPGPRSERSPRSVKAVRLTKTRPSPEGHPMPQPGTVVVKLTVAIPAAAFMPLQPEAVIVIPADLVEAHPITVEATDPKESLT